MPEVTLTPTIPLNDYAKNHLNEIRFGKEEPLKEPKATVEERKLNWFGKFVKKSVENQSTPAAIAKVVIFLVLTLSIVGIPFVAIWIRERSKQMNTEKTHKVAMDKLNIQAAQINARANIIDKLNLQDKFSQLPELNLGNRMGPTDYINFLKPEDLAAPIMKGTDKYNRPFIAIKMTAENHTFVAVIFERYNANDLWVWYSNSDLLIAACPGATMRNESFNFFKAVINGENEKFKIAV